MKSHHIIIALIGNNQRDAIYHMSIEQEYHVHEYITYDDIITHIDHPNLHGILVSSELTIDHLNFYDQVRSIPVVTLMKRDHDHYRYIEVIYNPPIHQYCADKISADELLIVMSYAGMDVHLKPSRIIGTENGI